VEVLVEQDDGELPIGAKRNNLLEKAEGAYIAFVDDDDLVAENYVKLVLEAVVSHPDVVGIHLIMTTNGLEPEKSYHSLEHRSWWDRPDPENGRRIYYRNPNHLNPVKRHIAMQVKFPPSNHGEDRDYSMRLLPLLQTEVVIKEPIYFYLNRWPKEC
jgi:glycosyltransferase involved in cell wall biosynthesis